MSSAFQLIEDTVLGSAAASITFNTGLTGYTKFRLTAYLIGDATTNKRPWLRLNGDTGANYADQALTVGDTIVNSARVTGQTKMVLGLNEIVTTQALSLININKPLSTTPARMSSSLAYYPGAILMECVESEWNNTAALINSISIVASLGNWAAGTRVVLEGAA